VITFIRSWFELYKSHRADEMKDDILLLMYQYIEQQTHDGARNIQSNVLQDCVSAMLPSHLKGISSMNVHVAEEVECFDGTEHSFNCALLAGRYTLYLTHSPHTELWTKLKRKMVPSDADSIDYHAILDEEATKHILENVMNAPGHRLSAMDREMMTPFFNNTRLKFVMLHTLCIGDYEPLLWMIGMKCAQFSGSPFGVHICASRMKHLQQRGGAMAVAVDLQSATIGKRSGGFTLILSDYEDDVVGGFMRTTRYEFNCNAEREAELWMERMMAMGAREEAKMEEWDSDVLKLDKRAQLERRLLLNMEVRKEVRHRREMGDQNECGCGAGSDCVLL